jgi:hypothetical protein
VPFSVLVALGNRFAWRHISNAGSALYVAIEQVGQPFTQAPAVVQASPSYSGPRTSSARSLLVFGCVDSDRVWHLGCALARIRAA